MDTMSSHAPALERGAAPLARGAEATATVRARYDRVAALLHWAIGLLLLGQIAFGFLVDEIAPRGTPARAGVINLHKSFGMVLGVLIVGRLAWRLAHRPPPWPATMSAGQRRAATLGHRALYACMLALPLAGYVGSNFSKHGVRFFGVPLAAWGPDWPGAYAFLGGVHIVTAWIFALLVAGHVGAALAHALVKRDGIFSRIVY